MLNFAEIDMLPQKKFADLKTSFVLFISALHLNKTLFEDFGTWFFSQKKDKNCG